MDVLDCGIFLLLIFWGLRCLDMAVGVLFEFGVLGLVCWPLYRISDGLRSVHGWDCMGKERALPALYRSQTEDFFALLSRYLNILYLHPC